MRLGTLIRHLSACSQDATVKYDFCGFVPDGLDSYRGYYDQLALGFKPWEKVVVKDLVALLKKAIGKTFQGYKGGNYKMDESTEIWVSGHGDAWNTAISHIINLDYEVILCTGYAR